MFKVAIKKGQLWKHKISGDIVIVYGKHGSKWNIVLNDESKRGPKSSHSVTPRTLWTKFVLQ